MFVSALIGNPTDHSVSPVLFGLYAAEHNIEYAHVKFNITLQNLKRVIRDLPLFGFTGANITLPYKIDVIPFLDELSPEIKRIGAVNTIANKNGTLIGYNTDMLGAVKTIENSLKRKITKSDRVVVFGAGGAARAVVSGILEMKASVTVLYRTPKSIKTVKFLEDFGGLVSLANINEKRIVETLIPATIVCNATSAGMYPKINDSPISLSQLKLVAKQSDMRQKLFFDVIFNPGKTRLLINAEKLGAYVVGGIDMMIHQGVEAFYLWTGKKVSELTIKKARKTLRELLL